VIPPEVFRRWTHAVPAREDVHAALRALAAASPPCIDLDAMHVIQVRGRARRELGTWPSADALLEQLVAALTAAADAEPEPERKGRLKAAALRVLDVLGPGGR